MDSTYGNSIKSSGNALILVLVLSLTVGLIILLSLETNVLLRKIMNTYKQEVVNFIAAENALLETESQLRFYPANRTALYSKIQFIPDNLSFAERQGIDFYQLEIEHIGAGEAHTQLQSIIGIRH